MAYQVKFVGKLRFTAKTPVHIGGAGEAATLYALKLGPNRFLIPATTWKGAFRNIAERLAPTMQMNALEKLAVDKVTLSENPRSSVRDLLQDFLNSVKGGDSQFFKPEEVKRVLASVGYSEEELSKLEDPTLALTEFLAYHCPIGRLFGNQVRAGNVRFTDTIFYSSGQYRPGVGIDRKTLTVKEKALFQIETSEAGVPVTLLILGEVDEPGSTPYKLLASTLEFVKEVGLNVGGRKSAGLGLLQLEHAEFHTVKLKEDKGGIGLGNPLKTPPLDLENFTKLLRG
ncbi:MAG: RAMP superfamily CRISPR-associated protein [Thermofilaceae archaeon]|nr:RAMP superfamily CRISPR-associated protein [Thermofilaceae archaeon]